MTIVEFLVALAARVESISAQPPAQGITPEQAAALAKATTDIAALKAEIADLKNGLGDLSSLPPI